jgi:hypothetical protein
VRETITLSSLYKDEAGALKALLKRSGVKETDAWWKQEFALGSDELGGSVQAPANDDGVMIASLIDGAAEKNMDMQLVAVLAADAGSRKGSKDRGSRSRRERDPPQTDSGVAKRVYDEAIASINKCLNAGALAAGEAEVQRAEAAAALLCAASAAGEAIGIAVGAQIDMHEGEKEDKKKEELAGGEMSKGGEARNASREERKMMARMQQIEVKEQERKDLIGATILKSFPPYGDFQGVIKHIRRKQRADEQFVVQDGTQHRVVYHVVYEDGDTEDLPLSQVLPLLVQASAHGGKERKRGLSEKEESGARKFGGVKDKAREGRECDKVKQGKKEEKKRKKKAEEIEEQGEQMMNYTEEGEEEEVEGARKKLNKGCSSSSQDTRDKETHTPATPATNTRKERDPLVVEWQGAEYELEVGSAVEMIFSDGVWYSGRISKWAGTPPERDTPPLPAK